MQCLFQKTLKQRLGPTNVKARLSLVNNAPRGRGRGGFRGRGQQNGAPAFRGEIVLELYGNCFKAKEIFSVCFKIVQKVKLGLTAWCLNTK